MAKSILIWFEIICENLSDIEQIFSEYYVTMKQRQGIALWKSREKDNCSYFLCTPNDLEKNTMSYFAELEIHKLNEPNYLGYNPGMDYILGDKHALGL